MNSLTKGDRVKVINNSNVQSVPMGTTGVVREVTDRDPQLLIVQLDTGFKVLLYNHEVELLPATDEVSAPSYYQPVLPAPDVEPESPALTPDEIMDITRSFCR